MSRLYGPIFFPSTKGVFMVALVYSEMHVMYLSCLSPVYLYRDHLKDTRGLSEVPKNDFMPPSLFTFYLCLKVVWVKSDTHITYLSSLSHINLYRAHVWRIYRRPEACQKCEKNDFKPPYF